MIWVPGGWVLTRARRRLARPPKGQAKSTWLVALSTSLPNQSRPGLRSEQAQLNRGKSFAVRSKTPEVPPLAEDEIAWDLIPARLPCHIDAAGESVRPTASGLKPRHDHAMLLP